MSYKFNFNINKENQSFDIFIEKDSNIYSKSIQLDLTIDYLSDDFREDIEYYYPAPNQNLYIDKNHFKTQEAYQEFNNIIKKITFVKNKKDKKTLEDLELNYVFCIIDNVNDFFKDILDK